MKRLFQKFGFRQSAYDRPNQKWVCGRACEGEACAFGPDLSGRCTVTYECRPHLHGNRWMCNRGRAGTDVKPCDEGPTPEGKCCHRLTRCTPVRSLRSKRGLVTLCVVALALALLLLTMTNPVGSRFMTPGELSHAHSSAESQCSDCHTAGQGLAIDWLHAMNLDTVAPESGKCISCHPMGEQPLNPHSLPMDTLTDIRNRVLSRASGVERQIPTGLKLAALGFLPNEVREGPIRCAACHVEHKGKDHDLRKVGNTQCQVCHSVQFSSFAHGHPSFGEYPFKRPTQIVFDHERHLKLHFKEAAVAANAPKDCLSCHVLDERGETAVIRGYEQSCAACHAKDFAGADEGAPAVAFLRVPLIDVEGLEEGEQAVGAWPDDWDSLGTTLTPFTLLLLAGDPAIRPLVQELGGTDLDMFDEDAFAKGGQLVWAFKELLHDLAENGMTALEKRLNASLDRALTPAERGALARLVNPAVIGRVVARWFPKLADEIKSRRAGEAPETVFMEADELEERLSVEPAALGGNWVRSDTELTLFYRPSHHADPFMKLWLELTSKAGLGGATNQASRLLESLSGNHQQVVPGRCVKCHTSERQEAPAMNWSGKRPNHLVHNINRFSHVAHFSLLDERGCITCHRLNFGTPERSYLTSFAYHGGDPDAGHFGNFKPIEKATCATCHVQNKAGEGCLSCHNYHVGRFESTRISEPPLDAIEVHRAELGGIEPVKPAP